MKISSDRIVFAILPVLLVAAMTPSSAQEPAAGQQTPRQAVTAAAEFDKSQVFEEVLGLIQEHFYDGDRCGDAWLERVGKFRQQAVAATSRDGFSEAVNAMLRTLEASHTKYYSRLDPRRYQLLGIFHPLYPADDESLFLYEGIGIDTRQREGLTVVSAVYDRLPADQAGLKFGDVILDVDGKPFHPILRFQGKAGTAVDIRVRRAAAEYTLSCTVEELDGRTMFARALESSKQVFERQGKKIAYLHTWSYAGAGYHETVRSELLWGELAQCDALVLDLRDGWGGASLDYLNLFREPILTTTYIPRDGAKRIHTGVWDKPVALLTNGGSTSGKELFTRGFQELKLGKVFGERTAGAVLAGRSFLLGNGDVLYLAVNDILVEGQRMEGAGVAPDFPVARQLLPADDGDPQLEKALQYLAG